MLSIALIFLIMTTISTILQNQIRIDRLPAIFLGLTQLMMYSMPAVMGFFMFLTVDYNAAFIQSVASKNTDSTIE
jgi:hypothetical protein